MPIETFSTIQGPYYYRYRSSIYSGWSDRLMWNLGSNGSMSTVNHYPLDTNIDDGGPWLMGKTVDTCTPVTFNKNVRENPFDDCYEGQLTIGGPAGSFTPLATTAQKSQLAMQGLGATAVARCAPTNPAFSVPQFIGELREGSPRLPGFASWKNRTRVARSAGNEYLNLEFGWKPMVSDIQSFARTVHKSHAIWNAYRKGSGQKTRVGYHYPGASAQKTYRGLHYPIPSEFGSAFGFFTGTTVQYRTSKTWFKGCFQYYVPEPAGTSDKWQYWHSEASKLLGIRLTPDTVWNLNPWTWAADWFANTGDLMTNVSNLGTDGLVLQYGYVMDEESILTSTAGSIEDLKLSSSRTYLQKRCQRVPANPYGFYATLSTLTSRQLAILAALGLSKGG